MAKTDYFLLLDTETTQDSLVADFGAVVVNRKGEIMTYCAALILGIYNDKDRHPLFWTDNADELWKKEFLPARYEKYNNMLNEGTRDIRAKSAVNRWLENVNGKYNPILTAYNLSFDSGKCRNTDIDLTIFKKRFCLMKAAQEKWATSKKYRQFILDNHYFKPPTKKGNMSYLTKAETMAHFVTGNDSIEPHTALEDVIDFELPILKQLVRTTKRDVWMNPKNAGWQNRQVKDWFKPI